MRPIFGVVRNAFSAVFILEIDQLWRSVNIIVHPVEIKLRLVFGFHLYIMSHVVNFTPNLHSIIKNGRFPAYLLKRLSVFP